MLSPYLPYPLNSGGRIRMFKQIEYFGERHELHLFTMDSVPLSTDASSALSRYCKRLSFFQFSKRSVEEQFPNTPRIVKKYLDPEIFKYIKTFVNGYKFDLILIEHIYLASYIQFFKGAICVLTEQNIESNILKQIRQSIPEIKKHIYFTQKIPWLENFPQDEPELLELYENTNWGKYTLRVVVSENDKFEMDARCNKGEAIVVRNGTEIRDIVKTTHSRNGILLMASMLYLPNLDGIFYFVDEIWPLIHKKSPNLILYLVGSNSPPEVRNLNNDGINIKVVASPENIEPIAEQCSVSVVPLRLGGGTRLKILHALSMGIPTVSTTIGCQGLHVENNKNILIQDAPKEFAESVLALTSNQDLWDRLRKNGRDLVEKHYSWNKIFEELEQKLLTAINMV